MAAASLKDWFEIHNLFIKYTTSLDRCEPEDVASSFTEDGTIDSPLMGALKGREAIRAFAERTVKPSREQGGQFRHVVSKSHRRGGGRVRRRHLLDCLTADGRTELLSPGEYRCTLRRV